MSTVRARVPPTRKKLLVSSARSNLTWLSGSISPISSRNRVPPSASSMSPGFIPAAPVNAPRSCPNSSLSSTSRGSVAAVDGHEGLIPAGRAIVDRAGDQLPAGAALAEDQHRGLGRRDAVDHAEHVECMRALTMTMPAGECRHVEAVAEHHVLADQPPFLGGLADQDVRLTRSRAGLVG
jgi:hypothetical protein